MMYSLAATSQCPMCQALFVLYTTCPTAIYGKASLIRFTSKTNTFDLLFSFSEMLNRYAHIVNVDEHLVYLR